jgi:hypothetical protein
MCLSGPDATPGRRPRPPGPGRLTQNLHGGGPSDIMPINHRNRRTVASLLLLSVLPCRLYGQNRKNEFWPEVDFYVTRGPQQRIVIIDSFNQDQDIKNKQGSFAYYFDFALKPFFRRDLRGQEDVFRKRYLSFRAGYQYTTSFINGESSSQKTIIAESTSRVHLPGKFVLLDRNRGDFRFAKDKPFSMRYRNRLWAERDFKIGGFVFTPYVYDEIYFDTSKGAWVPNRYAAGLQIPVGIHVVLETYYLAENDKLDTPKHVNAAGLTLNLYF